MKPFFALCLYLQKNIEIWCLTLLLKTGNIVHELVTESFTNQKTRLTIVHERLFSINRLVPLVTSRLNFKYLKSSLCKFYLEMKAKIEYRGTIEEYLSLKIINIIKLS